ncbi:MAG: hypothetical protein POH28_01595 [Acidocella sp.]|nr:hypothetical protein [Acidocella sp.]
MQTKPDIRIPILWSGTGDVYLVQDSKRAPTDGYVVRFSLGLKRHAPGCGCCAGRGPAATALGWIFQARARAEISYFTTLVVVATADGQAAIRDALDEDPVARSLFKL